MSTQPREAARATSIFLLGTSIMAAACALLVWTLLRPEPSLPGTGLTTCAITGRSIFPLWILFNRVIWTLHPPDPYPFIFFNLLDN